MMSHLRTICFLFGITCATVSAEPLRIMTYNVWVGFNKKQNLTDTAQWIAKQNVDVLALQELKGVSLEKLKSAAETWGHPYAVIYNRKGGYPQGLTSKKPIENIVQFEPDDPRNLRGTLYAQSAGIHFFVVHFDPQNYLKRQIEAAAVADRVRPLIEADKTVVVLGDFNAHAPADLSQLLKQSPLLKKWETKEKENRGFRIFDKSGAPDTSVLSKLLGIGLSDPAAMPLGTFPTRILSPNEPFADHTQKLHRIDYILTHLNAPWATATVSFPRDPILDILSDHYPVILDLNGESDEPAH